MRSAAVALAAALSVAACSGLPADRSSTLAARDDLEPSPTPTAASRAPQSERHSLLIEQTYGPGPNGELYTEGARSEVILTGPEGAAQTLQGTQDATLTAALAPGRYLVQPGLRPCSGHCSQRLAARTGTCETTVEVPGTRQLRVHYVVNQSCTIERG